MNRKLKGFTMVELIVVISIIAVLTGVLVPSSVYFIRQSKLKTANAQARVVFNASLTISQEYESKNLNVFNIKTGDGNPGGLSSIDFSNLTTYDSLDKLAVTLSERINEKLMESPGSDGDVWAVRYESKGTAYPVLTGACYSTTKQDRYVGCYPNSTPASGFSGTYVALEGNTNYWLTYAANGTT